MREHWRRGLVGGVCPKVSSTDCQRRAALERIFADAHFGEFGFATVWEAALCRVRRMRLTSGWEIKVGPPAV